MICKVIKHNDKIYLTTDEEIKKGDNVLTFTDKWQKGILDSEACFDGSIIVLLEVGKSFIGTYTSCTFKIIASTDNLEGVVQIPDEFISVCERNDEVEIKNVIEYPIKNYHYISTYRTIITPVEKVQENINKYIIDDSTLVRVDGKEYNVNYLTFCNLRLAEKKNEITLEYYHNKYGWMVVKWFGNNKHYKPSEMQEKHTHITDQMID